MLADLMQPILNFLRILCYVVLTYYLFKVLVFIVFGKYKMGENVKPPHAHRLREAMALGYTGVAAYFIFSAINGILQFTNNLLNAGSSLNTPKGINQLLVLFAAVIGVAFICNFCRSLWMLKLLDHAVFEPVSDWEQLTKSTGKRLAEFVPRAAAALLFIGVELELKRLGSSTPEGNIARGAVEDTSLVDTGKAGFLLYIALIVWWINSRVFIRAKMPKLLLLFYIAGITTSLFIYFYGKRIVGTDEAWWMVILVLPVASAALYMVCFVCWDVLPGIFRGLQDAVRWIISGKGRRNGTNLADLQ